MLPKIYDQRFTRLMTSKNEEISEQLQTQFSRESADLAARGHLGRIATAGLFQNKKIGHIQKRASAVVDIHKTLIPTLGIAYTDTLADELKTYLNSWLSDGWFEKLIESDLPPPPLNAHYQEALRAQRQKVMADNVLQIDLLVDGLRTLMSEESIARNIELDKQFKHILLLDHQRELLLKLIGGAHSVPQEQRTQFVVVVTMGNPPTVVHPGLPEGFHLNMEDVQALSEANLLRVTTTSKGSPAFSVTPLGFHYSQWLRATSGEPALRIMTETRSYLDSGQFKNKYPGAYEKWARAELLLWGENSASELTTIGHVCREAMQDFVSILVERLKPLGVLPDKAKTVARMKSVLKHVSDELGMTLNPFLEALIAYWGTLGDLVQRQEHGAQKEGDPLAWADARRVVFHTAIVMFEIDQVVTRLKPK